jgi:hypothetical protein
VTTEISGGRTAAWGAKRLGCVTPRFASGMATRNANRRRAPKAPTYDRPPIVTQPPNETMRVPHRGSKNLISSLSLRHFDQLGLL